MTLIENEALLVEIDSKGAELKSIFSKQTKLDYLWNADPAFWAKSSPVLFPIVGTLKEDTMFFNGQPYKMGRHGFARDRVFSIETNTGSSVTFLLVSDAETRNKFPFGFEFRITYRLEGNSLSVTFNVSTPGPESLWFSVGAHPAFRIPLLEGEKYDEYSIHFEKPETAGRWLISKDGLIEDHSTPLLENTDRLSLKHELFYKDAIVLKHLQSTSLSLEHTQSGHGLKFEFPGFPFLGIWAAKDADFVCIEPWCGIADSVNSNQQLTEKEGIEHLEAGGKFERTWTVTLY